VHAEEVVLAGRAREQLALYRKNEDLISIGAYTKGANAALDQAVTLHEPLKNFSGSPCRSTCPANKRSKPSSLFSHEKIPLPPPPGRPAPRSSGIARPRGFSVHRSTLTSPPRKNIPAPRRDRRPSSVNFSAAAANVSAPPSKPRISPPTRLESSAETESERRSIAARAEMDRCRAAYLEAHRKLEIVRRLEEKARSAYRLDAAREEQNAFDDFAGRQHSLRRPLLQS